MTTSIINDKPDITYPCHWQYTIIGTNKAAMILAIAAVLDGQEHILRPSKKSSGGKYLSMVLDIEVQSAQFRNELFSNLCNQAAIRMVI